MVIMTDEPSVIAKNNQFKFLKSLRQGFQYAFSRQELIGSYAIDFITMIFGMPVALFPAIAHKYGGPKIFRSFICDSGDRRFGIFRSTRWNQTIPAEFRGRLSGIEMISYLSGPKLGDVEAGFVAALFGIFTSIISCGVLCMLDVGMCGWLLPKFWKYRAE